MPILKTEILGSQIEIEYQENELEKLLKLLEDYKKRLSEFPNNALINPKVIMVLSALKAEDQLQEIKKILIKNKKEQKKIEDISNINKNLTKEIIFLKEDLEKMKLKNLSDYDLNIRALNEIKVLKNALFSIQEKIKSAFDK